MESIVDTPSDQRTGWLRAPKPELWSEALSEILRLTETEKLEMRQRAKKRARDLFGMEAMAKRIEESLNEAVAMGKVRSRFTFWMTVLFVFLGLLFALVLV